MRCGRGEPGASLQIFTASEEIVDIFDFAQLHPKNTFPRGNERKSAKYEKVASESNFPHGEREKMPGPKCSLGVNVFKGKLRDWGQKPQLVHWSLWLISTGLYDLLQRWWDTWNRDDYACV